MAVLPAYLASDPAAPAPVVISHNSARDFHRLYASPVAKSQIDIHTALRICPIPSKEENCVFIAVKNFSIPSFLIIITISTFPTKSPSIIHFVNFLIGLLESVFLSIPRLS
jgi:hypothetical protein